MNTPHEGVVTARGGGGREDHDRLDPADGGG